jgi:hypothetical protein
VDGPARPKQNSESSRSRSSKHFPREADERMRKIFA